MVPVAPPTFLTQMQQMDTDEELGIVNDNDGSDLDQSPEREPEIITFSGFVFTVNFCIALRDLVHNI